MIDDPLISTTFPRHTRIKQNLAVWSQQSWQYFNVDYIEGIMPSSPTVIDRGAAVANATIAAAEIALLDVDVNELMQIRWAPLDDVEGVLWLTRSQAKGATRGVHSRTSKGLSAFDPLYETTEFNILGRDRNAFIEVRNLGDYGLAQARFVFWGWKYILTPLKNVDDQIDVHGIMWPVTKGTSTPIPMTYVVAEGRQ